MGCDAVNAAAALARAEAAGVRLVLDAAGAVRMRASVPPPPALLADLRQHREAVAALLLERERVAFYQRAIAEAGEALAAFDPDLATERAAIAATMAAEARGELGHPLSAEAHQSHLAGLRGSAMQRPPSWADQTLRPTPGCWCGCCRGRRWWAPQRPSKDGIGIGQGWCCATCHPAPPGTATIEVQT